MKRWFHSGRTRREKEEEEEEEEKEEKEEEEEEEGGGGGMGGGGTAGLKGKGFIDGGFCVGTQEERGEKKKGRRRG